MSKILIAGGTGLVGKHLTKELLKGGHEVVYLSRKAGYTDGIKSYRWNIVEKYIDPHAFDGVNAIINLAGAPIAGRRWTKAYKTELYESRVRSTGLLVNFIHANYIKLDGFVSTSAAGVYGNDTHISTTEVEKPGTDFLAKLCSDWEEEAQKLNNNRLVILRVGVVLAKESGFIPKMSVPIRLGVGAVLGNGKQQISWIHIADLVALYLRAINDSTMIGIYNAVSPNPECNRTITNSLASKLNRCIFFPPIPKAALRIMFGELSSTLLANQHISSLKVEKLGFRFQYPLLQNALDDLL